MVVQKKLLGFFKVVLFVNLNFGDITKEIQMLCLSDFYQYFFGDEIFIQRQ